MPRAHRHYVPEQVWHITHRCHEQSFLLRFPRDRRRYRHWLFEAKRRFGLCVLDFVVTSNHVHLLVKDTAEGVIAQSMQLAAGRTAQEYNERRGRRGAYWEDRYHATAIEAGEHLRRCLVYIDLNMVRAGVVAHPGTWAHGGFVEIQCPRARSRLIDLPELSRLCGFTAIEVFQAAHREWVEQGLSDQATRRQSCWSEALAVGGRDFVDAMKRRMGDSARYRTVEPVHESWMLREPQGAYSVELRTNNDCLRPHNGPRMHI